MKIIVYGLLAFIMFSCNQKPKKEVKHNFPSADAAFKYFVDTSGLEKVSAKKHMLKFQKSGGKVKHITKYLYYIYFSENGKMSVKKDLIDFIVYNDKGNIKCNYMNIEGEKFSYIFTYNNQNQLTNIKTYDCMNVTNKGHISSIQTFMYNSNQDSVIVQDENFYGSSEGTIQTYSYNKKTNKIRGDVPKFKLETIDAKLFKEFTRLNKNVGLYKKKHISYY